MAELTVEQQRALALAAARKRQADALPGKYARGAMGAVATADAWKDISSNPVKAAAQLAGGAFDVVGGGIAGLAERIEGVGRGLIGAVNPNDTYHDARRRTPPPWRDPQPVSAGGRVVQGALSAIMGGTGVPDVLNAAGGGIERVGDAISPGSGPDLREALGTAAETATVAAMPLFRGRVAAGPLPAAQARAVARMENAGYVVPPHRPTGPGGEIAGSGAQNFKSALATHTVNDSKLSVVNQDVTQRWAARANAIKGEISPESIQAYIRRAEVPYDELRQSGVDVLRDIPFLKEATEIADEAAAISPAAARSVRQVLAAQDTGSVIDNVRQLRQQGFKRIAGENVEAQEIGALQLRAADALDGVLDRSLQRAASRAASPTEAALYRRLYDGYVQGRASRANLHILEEATNVAGEVDAAVIHRIGQRRTLNPLYEEISHAYELAPTVMVRVDQASRTARTNAFTIAPSTISGIGSMLAKFAARRRGTAATPQAARSPMLTEMRARNRRALVKGTARGAALNSALGDEQQ